MSTSATTPPSAETVAKSARSAYEASQLIDSSERDLALERIRALLEQNRDAVLEANQKDLDVRRPSLFISHVGTALMSS